MNGKTKILMLAIFAMVTGIGASQEIEKYREVSAISMDPEFTTATIYRYETSTRSRRGKGTTTYEIDYYFRVGDKSYYRNVSLGDKLGASAVERGTLRIVYLKSDPNVNKLESRFSEGEDLVWELLGIAFVGIFAAVLLGLLYAYKFGWSGKGQEISAKSAI